MESFLDFHDVLDVVNGKVMRPTDNTPEVVRQQVEWDKLDKKARFCISQALEANQIRHVMALKTAAEMWKRFESLYEQKNPISIHMLLAKFYEYKMKPGMNVAEHVAKIEEMASQLKDLGQPQEEKALITKVLTSLPKSYRPLLTAWDSVPEDQQTMENLMPRLLKEEDIDKSTGELNLNEDEETTALFSKTGKHNQQQFSKNSQNQLVRQKSKFKGNCHYCAKFGHMKRDCRKWKVDQKNSQANPADSGSSAAAFSATNSWPAINDDEIWLGDSGATQHMTFHREWFCTFEPVGENQRPVTIGNDDVVFAKDISIIEVERQVGDKILRHMMYDVLYVPEISRNLFSLGAACEKGASYKGTKEGLKIFRNGQCVAIGQRYNYGLYSMNMRVIKSVEANVASSQPISIQKLHERLGHANYKLVEEVIKGNAVIGLPPIDIKSRSQVNDDNRFCESCVFGKQHKRSFFESAS